MSIQTIVTLRPFLPVTFAGSLAFGCGLPSTEITPDATVPTSTNGAAIVLERPEQTAGAYELISVQLNGDKLDITAAYLGGCQDHFWYLFWNQMFDGSNPAQATLEFLHDSQGDVCQTQFSVVQSYDLAIIRNVYAQQFNATNGTVQLNVGDKNASYSF